MKITEDMIRNWFVTNGHILTNEKIADINIYDDGKMCDVITISENHIPYRYTFVYSEILEFMDVSLLVEQMAREFDFEGYHTEVSGNGYDLLVREYDDRVIARYEGDYYKNILDMTTGNYNETDYFALVDFYFYCTH